MQTIFSSFLETQKQVTAFNSAKITANYKKHKNLLMQIIHKMFLYYSEQSTKTGVCPSPKFYVCPNKPHTMASI